MRNASLYRASAEALSPSLRFTPARPASAVATSAFSSPLTRTIASRRWKTPSARACFPGPAEGPRERPEVEERGRELPPETGIAARRDYCPVKAFGGAGVVALGQ